MVEIRLTVPEFVLIILKLLFFPLLIATLLFAAGFHTLQSTSWDLAADLTALVAERVEFFDFRLGRNPQLPCGRQPPWSLGGENRVAVILRGAAFRNGGRLCLGNTDDPEEQLFVYDTIIRQLIVPFEAAGYAVDVFTVTYHTPLDKYIRAKLGTWLRVYQLLNRSDDIYTLKGQALSMYANLVALARYASDRRQWYRVLIMTRHDFRWLPESRVVSTLLASGNLDNAIFIQKRSLPYKWCPQLAGESEEGWAGNDFVHIISSMFIGCFMDWMYNESWLPKEEHGNLHYIRYWNECMSIPAYSDRLLDHNQTKVVNPLGNWHGSVLPIHELVGRHGLRTSCKSVKPPKARDNSSLP